MDTTYTPQPQSPRMHPHVSRGIGAILIAVLIVLAIFGIARYWHAHPSAGSLSGASSLTLSPDAPPIHNVQTVDLAHGKIVPAHIDSQGTQNLYAVVTTQKNAYYLISGPALNQSTLYRMDLSNTQAGLQQLSTSTSEKLELSVNEPVSMAAYTVQVNGTPHVIAFDFKAGKETDLGEGEHPVVLGSGASVLFEQNGKLISKDIVSGKTYELASIASGAPFAVDRVHALFALYNPGAKDVYTYQLMNDGTISQKVDSIPVSTAPEAMFYQDGVLYLAHMEAGTLVISSIDALHTSRIPALGFSLAGFTLSSP